MTSQDEDEVARELAALLRMRSEVHRRVCELTGEGDIRVALRVAHRLIDAFRDRREARRRERDPDHSGWGRSTATAPSWTSVWASASAGLPGHGKRR